MAPSSQNGSLAVIGLSRLANERTKLASVTTVAKETMADVRCFCLCVVDYQNCSCPDRLICREYTNNCAPPKKSLSIIHRQKEKEGCADGSCNRKNDARFQVLTEDEFSKLQEGYKPVIKWSARSGHLTTLKCGGELK